LEKVLGHARILGEPPPLLAVMASAAVPSVSQVTLVLNSISCIICARSIDISIFQSHKNSCEHFCWKVSAAAACALVCA
jgi:ABC-type phosphate transport system permease subunit